MTLYATEYDDETWDETTADWITLRGDDFSSPPIPAPTDPLLLDSIDINQYSVGDEVLIDITKNLVAAKLRGDAYFTVMLFGGATGAQSNYSFWSKEHANFEYAPHVIFTVPTYPQGGTLMILR